MVALPLEQLDDAVLRGIHALTGVADSYDVFRSHVLRGELKRYRLVELRLIARELAKVYKDTYTIAAGTCKAQLIRQIEFFRQRNLCGAAVASTAKTAAPTPPPATPQTHDMTLLSVGGEEPPANDVRYQLLRALPFPHEQPVFPIQRWIGNEAMVYQRAGMRVRQQMRVNLSPEEHQLLADRRKRSTALHMVCLTEKLTPSQWPESTIIKVDGRRVDIPHASWRVKDENRDWCRTVCPVDLTQYINQFSRCLWANIEVTGDEKHSHVFAVCIAANKGVRAVYEETKTAVLRRHRIRTGHAIVETPTIAPLPAPPPRDPDALPGLGPAAAAPAATAQPRDVDGSVDTVENFETARAEGALPPASPAEVGINGAAVEESTALTAAAVPEVAAAETTGEAEAPDAPAANPPPRPSTQGTDVDEVLVGKTSVSIQDPVTLARVTTPVKGSQCTHSSVFDLHTYIEFCSSSRMWVCPECEAPAPLEELVFDEMFHDILTSPEVHGDRGITQVILHPDGSWEPKFADPLNTPRMRPEKRKRDSDVVLLDDSDDDDCDSDAMSDFPGIGPQGGGGGGARPPKRRRGAPQTPGEDVLAAKCEAPPLPGTPLSDAASVAEMGTEDHPIEL